MTVLRTDLIPNIFPNGIATVSKASPAVVTVPVIERVVSATGTVNIPTATGAAVVNTNTVTVSGATSTIYVGMSVSGTNIGANAVVTGIAGSVLSLSVNSTGTGSSTLTFSSSVSLMSTTAGLKVGDIITATDGVGSFGSGTVSVRSIAGTQAILISATSAVTAGTVTDISLPAVSTLPPLLASGDVVQITINDATLTFTQSASTGTFQVGQLIRQATTNAKGIITGVNYNGVASTLTINTVAGTFNTTNLVSGPILGETLTPIPAPTMTPTAVVGMTELLTAGVSGSNTYFVDVLTGTTFALYRNVGLSTAVDSSAFTTAVANTGQYTTIDAVEITVAP